MTPDQCPQGQHPPGSLAYYDEEQVKWVVGQPHSPMFSTITMLATHYTRDGTTWTKILNDGEDMDQDLAEDTTHKESNMSEPPAQVFGIIDPDYARVFTQARIIAWSYGYACLAHGSFTRDLDLLLVPWTETAQAEDVDYFAPRIAEAAGLKVSPSSPGIKPHGRKAWTLLFPGFADKRWVDLSVLPPASPPTHKE